MRACAVALSGALAVFTACGAPAPPKRSTPPSGTDSGLDADAGLDQRREDALRRARVWSEPRIPIASADLGTNPPDAGELAEDRDVSCEFRLRASVGWSPKFECVLASGEEVKVKYGHNSVEVFGEVAATRLLSALGFGADRMYVVRSVRCHGCPAFPYPRMEVLDAVESVARHDTTFTMAVIERKMAGRAIKGQHAYGWTWSDLARIDPAAGGSSRTEVDALRLMGMFLNDWDNKAPNQRLTCLDPGVDTEPCARPFALLQDVGETFGPRGVDLDGWRRTPIWSDPATCHLSMKDLPYAGATFAEADIGEAGRRFLGDRLRQLSRAQTVALFTGARFAAYARQSEAGRSAENWANVFEERVREIVDRAPCPR
ncbi:MAG TPA: hypothetical protein VGQ33_14535 [Vicinamibacteria bacterium]|nr:hypothetical protein [Vicinamibacteria bacterium]